MRKIMIAVFLLIGLISLAACGTGNDENTQTNGDIGVDTTEEERKNDEEVKQDDEQQAWEEEEGETTEEEGGTTDSSYEQTIEDEGGTTTLPVEKKLTIRGEMEETKTAKLNKSSYGYFIYVLDDYIFSSNKNNESILQSTKNEHFFVRIEPIAAGTDMDTFKADAKQELEKSYQNVVEYKVDETPGDFFKDADYYLVGLNNETVKIHSAKTIDGKAFRFHVNMQNSEMQEGIEPAFWAMLGSIELE